MATRGVRGVKLGVKLCANIFLILSLSLSITSKENKLKRAFATENQKKQFFFVKEILGVDHFLEHPAHLLSVLMLYLS